MDDRIYTVSEFNKLVKNYLDDNPEFQEFFLKGELSGVTYYKSGHLYFTLKDKNGQVRCAAFNYKFKRIPEDLKEGDSVKIFGDVGFYENRGEFQILVRNIEKENSLGEMFLKLEKLKLELQEKGIFSPLFKQKLPKYPMGIGVVTSYTGAVFQDIINTTRKRFENIDIYIYPAKVQGDGAKEEIAKGIEALNRIENIDLIIVGRGGGSVEDLWAFNEKEVALAIFDSKKPIISAVGHEIDNLLSDLVADVRAATPTQAIEISVPVKSELIYSIEERKKHLKYALNNIIEHKRKDLEKRENSYIIKSYFKEMEKKTSILIEKEERLNLSFKNFVEKRKTEIELKAEKLLGLNPMGVFSRGYTITFKNSQTIKSVEDLSKGDRVETIFVDGKIYSKVEEIFKNEEKNN